MVRGPAALLVASLSALAYFLLAGALPDLGRGDAAVLVAGSAGVGLVAAVVLSVVSAGEAPGPVALLLLGSTILVAGMGAAGAGASVSAFEALAAGALGTLLGRALATPAVALAVPVFVAVVDAWSTAADPAVRPGGARGSDELTFDLPAWGAEDGLSSRLGLVDAVFLATFAVWARRFGLRPRATVAGMVGGLLASVVLTVALDRAVPALPLVAVGYWVPNVDRFGGVLRHGRTE